MKTSLPTVDHPEIPSGLYCYTYEGGKQKNCPHWKRTEKGAKCDLINEDHTKYCCFHLVWDQVKHCGINEDRDYEPITKTEEEYLKEGWKPVKEQCPCGIINDIWTKKGL